MPFKEYQSVYTPDELAKLAGVLDESMRRCVGDEKDIAAAEFGEIRRILAKVIIEQYKAGEKDIERLKAIALDRATYYGYCVEFA